MRELEQTHTSLEVRCQRASAEADRIKAILAGLADPILAIDDFDELVLANRSAEVLFSFETGRGQGTGRSANCCLARSSCDLLSCHAAAETGRPPHATRNWRSPTPRDNRTGIRATAVMKLAAADRQGQQDGRPTGAVAVLRDIGDQKTLQKRNAEFVSSVSHEMKTPLAGIKAYVELLADGDAEDEATREEFLGVINGQADRLQRLVDNLLNLARIEAGVVSVSKQQPLAQRAAGRGLARGPAVGRGQADRAGRASSARCTWACWPTATCCCRRRSTCCPTPSSTRPPAARSRSAAAWPTTRCASRCRTPAWA